MSIQIVEIVGRKKCDGVEKWYAKKIKRCAHFLVNKTKNDIITTRDFTHYEKKEMEVVLK
nr:hypothetical protein 9 [bacterium]